MPGVPVKTLEVATSVVICHIVGLLLVDKRRHALPDSV